METCNECLYQPICNTYASFGVTDLPASDISPCELFKNRADFVEVVHGEWIYKHRHRGGFERRTTHDEYGNPHTVTLDNRYECEEPYCSVCGKIGGDFLNYCGNCGAKMDGRSEV